MASVAPKAYISGDRKQIVRIPITEPKVAIRKRPFPKVFRAFTALPSPVERLKREAPPIPKRAASAVIMVARGNVTVVAAIPSSPMPPNEDLIYDVVNGIDKRTNDSGDSKCPYHAFKRLCTKTVLWSQILLRQKKHLYSYVRKAG